MRASEDGSSAENGLLEPADDLDRMDAYYYGFDETGIGVIDRILSAVARAGKMYHHTECWTDTSDHEWGCVRVGESPAGAIQRYANDAAAAIRASAIPPGADA